MKCQPEGFTLKNSCKEFGYAFYIKGKKNFNIFLTEYKDHIEYEKNLNRYIEYKDNYVIYNNDIVLNHGLAAIYKMMPYLRRSQKTYKDNKYYYIYFYNTLIVKLEWEKLQDIWNKRIENGKEKSFSSLRFALGGFNKYMDYALEHYCYFILGITPKEF